MIICNKNTKFSWNKNESKTIIEKIWANTPVNKSESLSYWTSHTFIYPVCNCCLKQLALKLGCVFLTICNSQNALKIQKEFHKQKFLPDIKLFLLKFNKYDVVIIWIRSSNCLLILL
jgi:hypothetical protein